MRAAVDLAKVEELFHAVVDLAPEEAARVLDAECPRGASAVREAVERLLFHHRAAPSTFLLPNAELAAEAVGAAESAEIRVAEPEDVLRVGESVGRFLVLKRLGAGAMAVVYQAYDESLDRQVALKVLRRGVALPAQLANEARALAKLTHPNVVQVYEVGVHSGRPFIAMELVGNGSLRAWLAERPRATVTILRVFVQAGRGLAAAHASGLVHRDFKPDNVLVGNDGRLRVVDFGISALSETSSESETFRLVGTPAFMSPEQFLGQRATAASDQFAFCVATYRALFGCAPFAGEDVPSLRENVVAGNLRPFPSSADAWIRRILTRGLAGDPRERFSTLGELLDAIERKLPADPELDPAMGRRERRLFAVSMSVLGIAVLGLVWWLGFRAHVQPTSLHFLAIPVGASLLHALAAIVLRRQLLGNRFARRMMLIVWIGIVTVLAHRVLALRFGQPLAEVLTVDLLMLGMEHLIAALLFERWFGLTALAFFVGAGVAILLPASAATAMLGAVIAAYAVAAASFGL